MYHFVFVGLGLVVIFVLTILAYAIVFRAERPVLFRYDDRADVSTVPSILVLNPFRDQTPEQPAVQVLKRLRKGDYSDFDRIGVNGKEQELKEKEAEFRLQNWYLAERTGDKGNVLLVYAVERSGIEGFGGLIEFELRSSNNIWEIQSIACIY